MPPWPNNNEVTAACDYVTAYSALDMAGCDQRALRSIGIDIDVPHMQSREGLAALHVDAVADHSLAVGQMASVPAGKGAENLDVLDGVIIGVAEREGDQALDPSPPRRQD